MSSNYSHTLNTTTKLALHLQRDRDEQAQREHDSAKRKLARTKIIAENHSCNSCAHAKQYSIGGAQLLCKAKSNKRVKPYNYCELHESEKFLRKEV